MKAPGLSGGSSDGTLDAMFARLIDRMPALLLGGLVLMSAHVALLEVDQPARLLASVPAALVLLFYLRAGRAARRARR